MVPARSRWRRSTRTRLAAWVQQAEATDAQLRASRRREIACARLLLVRQLIAALPVLDSGRSDLARVPIMRELEARLLVDCRNLLGECVVWNPSDERVYWTDVYGQ